MITSVKKSNADKYSALYEDVSKYLMTHNEAGDVVPLGDTTAIMPANVKGEAGQEEYFLVDKKTGAITDDPAIITSLEEFFSYIVDIGTLPEARHFTVLPLDEDKFEIDANTRLITVPSSFATNGISVQGDEVAEIIYFRINRFYDAQDLSLKDIYIQWTAPNGKSGVSVPWVVDIESEPNYIIFGWPLSSTITSSAGTVSFSVRFYSISEETGKVDYSLATLTQSATIKESLNYALTSLKTDGLVVDNATNLISGRFENTTPSSSTIKAEVPEYVLNYDKLSQKSGEYDAKLTEGEEGTEIHYVKADLDLDDDGFRTVEFYAPVAALSSDAGSISYKAQKLDYDDKTAVENTARISFKPTTDTKRAEGKLYYYLAKNDDGAQAYKLYTGELDEDSKAELFAATKVGSNEIFERVYEVLVDSIGWYTITATNRVRTVSAKKKSYTIEVPRPVKVEITTDLEERDIIHDNLDNSDRDDNYSLTIGVRSKVADRGKMTYQWFRKAPGADEFVEINGATSHDYKIQGWATEQGVNKEGTNELDHYEYTIVDEKGVAAGDGYYYCKITNNLNKEKDVTDSSEIRISHPATAPKITLVSKDAYSLGEIKGDDQLEIIAQIPEDSGELVPGWRTDDDTITYQWYRYYSGGSSVAEDIQKAIDGTYKKNHDINLYAQAMSNIDEIKANVINKVYSTDDAVNEAEGAKLIAAQEAIAAESQTAAFNPTESGYYFCEATNTYNGTTASTLSRFFTVSNA